MIGSSPLRVVALCLAFNVSVSGARSAMESQRQLPIAYSVDVVVVGGSTHAVAAAAAAAGKGATVFLAAPRPYLGEDLCATLRLSLPPGEAPATELGRRIFAPSLDGLPIEGLPFSYETDRPAAAKHSDTQPPSVLTDGQRTHASAHSVQYDGSVTITADLGSVRLLQNVRLFAFEKTDDYGVAAVHVQAGAAKADCQPIGKTDRRVVRKETARWSLIEMAMPVACRARYVKVLVERPENCRRLLLSELVIEADEGDAVVSDTPATTPHRIKSTLDHELLRAGVQFLHGCYATDVLVDNAGKPAGIVMANRAGRQTVVAGVIIDATDRAAVARMAGAHAREWPGGALEFERVVLEDGKGGKLHAVRHRLDIAMPDGSYASFARAEQEARDRTYQDGQLRASAFLFHVPVDSIVCRTTAAEWSVGALPDIGHFQPRGVDRLYVLSGCADIPRSEAKRLLRPLGLVEAGERVGAAAAMEAQALPARSGLRVGAAQKQSPDRGRVREILHGTRPTDRGLQTIPSPARSVPVLAEYDVVVIGGGTSGAAAAIGAARRGVKTLVVEYLEGLGGVGTLGLIGKPYHGKETGFGAEVPFPDKEHNVEHKMEWYRRELSKAGADIWLGALGCGALVEGGRVVGAVVATPQGRGVVLAHTTIDATGNADVAVAAGASHMYGANEKGIALQGTGLPVRPLDRYYVNSDYLLVDESDMVDVWRALVGTREAMGGDVFDAGTLIQTRERRRVLGDHVLRYLDQIVGRTYPDSIVFSASDYDSHGYPSHPYFALIPHDEKSRAANHPAPGGTCYTPYRCLLPKGLDGILVVGVGISMERDASAMVRMQRDVSNQGYAAGVAAAMAAESGCTVRGIDVRALQRHLVETGALTEEVLSHQDSLPLPASAVREAVADLSTALNPSAAARPLAVVLLHQEAARPLLKAAYASATGEAKLTYAKALGVLGDPSVVDTLADALDDVREWDAKILQGVAAEYAHLPTPIDALILALGSTRDPRALPSILRKLETLDAGTTLSHHRAVALALERIGDPAAAKPLADLLSKPGMRAHAMAALEPLHNREREKRRRTGPLRQIVLARVLYRCGDYEGLGEQILREYLRDIRGLFARHAQAVLDAGKDFRAP